MGQFVKAPEYLIAWAAAAAHNSMPCGAPSEPPSELKHRTACPASTLEHGLAAPRAPMARKGQIALFLALLAAAAQAAEVQILVEHAGLNR